MGGSSTHKQAHYREETEYIHKPVDNDTYSQIP